MLAVKVPVKEDPCTLKNRAIRHCVCSGALECYLQGNHGQDPSSRERHPAVLLLSSTLSKRQRIACRAAQRNAQLCSYSASMPCQQRLSHCGETHVVIPSCPHQGLLYLRIRRLPILIALKFLFLPIDVSR